MKKKAKKYINGAVDKLVTIIQSNGTPRPENANVPDENLPWMFARLPPLEIANCMLWKGIIFDIFCVNFLHKEDRFIPQGCQNCHKVVVKPRTYKELLDLRKLQVELDYPSKCGIEERSFSKGLYGGYFYCGGIEDGRSRFKEIRSAIPKDVPVYLKRGCTEYEIEFGPSDQWKIAPYQDYIEKRITSKISVEEREPIEKYFDDVSAIQKRWEAFAWKFDPTYSGPDLFPKQVVYSQ